MIPSRRRKIAALVLFALLIGVVLAGMSWASAATLELAKRNIRDEHDRMISLALGKLSTSIGSILVAETYRDFWDYSAVHPVKPIESRSLNEPTPAEVLVPSPLLIQGPSLHWIELYFQYLPFAGENGELTSPQLLQGEYGVRVEDVRRDVSAEARARSTWHWFSAMACNVDFDRMISGANSREALASNLFDENQEDELVSSGTESPQGPRSKQVVSKDYFDRTNRMRIAQIRHTPPPACESLDVISKNLVPSDEESDGAARAGTTETTIDPGPIAPPFWLDTPPELGRRLAFIRECRVEQADDMAFYQGFIGNWDLLRSDLLEEIDDIFPPEIRAQVDIIPLPNDVQLDAEMSKRKLTSLPATLEVPYSAEGVTAAAWDNVGGVLMTGWGAAILVLGIAGWGVRNLLAISERRMQFAYAVTHELRTPLTTFRLYSDMLAAGLVPEESRAQYLDTLARESLRLSGLVQDVLEFARLEHHRVRLHPRSVDADGVLSQVRETLKERCHAFGIEPVAETALRNGRLFFVDADVINRIAAVLISNACRHTRSSAVKKVVIRLHADRDKLHLDVIDSGSGIELGDARSIFKPFRRGRGAEAAAQGGLGLGLALARDWAALLGGRLDLVARHDPEYGGAHFRLSIPANQSKSAEDGESPV
ncbi:MAG: HAMP domain-containing histidine kinase [Phycisphaerae bacterium]|nr:HAMP domain-containing histidine kinase [Phycisphaerae bacterium]